MCRSSACNNVSVLRMQHRVCGGAVPGGDLASLHEEVQQLKGVVNVLTSATHLMAIPTASDVPGNAQRTSSHLVATWQLWSVNNLERRGGDGVQ